MRTNGLVTDKIIQIRGNEHMNDALDCSERNPKGKPTELDESAVLNLSCFEHP